MTEPTSTAGPIDPAELVPHRFCDPTLLADALTHASWSHENGGPDNERLEFLGDAVLQLCVSRLLYQRFAELGEDRMTEIRKRVVNNRALADVARAHGLGASIRLGVGAAGKDGLRDNDKVLASALEAVLAAVFLDGGLDAAAALVDAWCGGLVAPGAHPVADAKNRLQERVQRDAGSAGRGRPVYALVERVGPDDAPTFTCEVRVDDRVLGRGRGATKKDAERRAAEEALRALAGEGP